MDVFWISVGLIVLAAIGKALFFSRADDSVASSAPTIHTGNRLGISTPPRRLAPFPLLRSSDPFDGAGSLIWRTQIPALRAVLVRGPQGAPCADLQPIYFELARQYPEIFDGQTFRDWGQFLVDLGLLRVVDQSAHITQAGRALLELLVPAPQSNKRDSAPRWAIRLHNACHD